MLLSAYRNTRQLLVEALPELHCVLAELECRTDHGFLPAGQVYPG